MSHDVTVPITGCSKHKPCAPGKVQQLPGLTNMQSLGVFLETSRGRFIHALMHADVPCLAVEEDPRSRRSMVGTA